MNEKKINEEIVKWFRTPQYGKLTILIVAGTLILFAATNSIMLIPSFVAWLMYSLWIIFVLFIGKPAGKPEEAVRLMIKQIIRVINNGDSPETAMLHLENVIKMAVVEWNWLNDTEIEEYCREKMLTEEETEKTTPNIE